MLSPLGAEGIIEQLIVNPHVNSATTETNPAITGLRHLIKAITYYQVSAFPGGSPARMAAYHKSRNLFDLLLEIISPLLNMSIQPHQIMADGVPVDSYLVLPKEATSSLVTIITNGLEGTVQELLIPLLRYQNAGMGIFVVEIPGTYAYQVPMPAASENFHHQLIDSIATHLAFVNKPKAS